MKIEREIARARARDFILRLHFEKTFRKKAARIEGGPEVGPGVPLE
jgi:hypothetical protein